MNRQELEKHIFHTYGVSPDFPWMKYPSFAVFRHESNQKWFAVVMTIDKSKLGIKDGGQIDVVNLKCEQALIPFLQHEKGIYPAYHMNRQHWITIALDGSANDDHLKSLLSLSYDLTDKKKAK